MTVWLPDSFVSVLTGTLWAFLASSAVIVIAGLCLSFLVRRGSRLGALVEFAHLMPFFCAPTYVAMVLANASQAAFGAQVVQNEWATGLLGVLFHTYVAHMCISRVLALPARLEELDGFCRNIARVRQGMGFLIRLRLILPTVSFTFFLVFVLQHSMVTVPAMLCTQTGLSNLRDYLTSAEQRLPVLVVAGSIVLGLWLAYVVPMWAVSGLIRCAARYGEARIVRREWVSWPSKFVSRSIAIFSIMSGLVHASAASYAVYRSFSEGLANAATISWHEALAPLASLWSLPTLASIVAFLLVGSWTLWGDYVGGRRPLATFRLADLASFVPTVLLGSLVFMIPPQPFVSARLLAFFALVCYGTLTLAFFSRHECLEPHSALRRQALRQRLPFLRKCAVVASTSLGLLPWYLAFVVFVLWCEDGIQTTLLGSSHGLARFTYGLRTSSPPPGTLLGIGLANSLVWGGLLAVSWLLRRRASLLGA